MFNLNLFIATVLSSVIGAVIAYFVGNVFAGITALGVGALSYWLVIFIEWVRNTFWVGKK